MNGAKIISAFVEISMKLQSGKLSSYRIEETAEERKQAVRRLLEHAKKYRKKLPAGFKFDRYEANERR